MILTLMINLSSYDELIKYPYGVSRDGFFNPKKE